MIIPNANYIVACHFCSPFRLKQLIRRPPLLDPAAAAIALSKMSTSSPGPSRKKEESIPGASLDERKNIPGASREKEKEEESILGASQEKEQGIPGTSREKRKDIPGASAETEDTDGKKKKETDAEAALSAFLVRAKKKPKPRG